MRCFIALELDNAIRSGLADVQRRLTDPAVAIRWVRAEQMHLTLTFLGEVPDARVVDIGRAISKAARGSAPFEVEVAGVGCFPERGRDVRVVWAGVRDASERLRTCHADLESALERAGFPREARSFSPHLTIGRSRSPRKAGGIRSRLEPFREHVFGVLSVAELVLFESVLQKTGPRYTVLVRERLGSKTASGSAERPPRSTAHDKGASP